MSLQRWQGLLALPFRSSYSASKHALQAFANTLRAEVANRGALLLRQPMSLRPRFSKVSRGITAMLGAGDAVRLAPCLWEGGGLCARVSLRAARWCIRPCACTHARECRGLGVSCKAVVSVVVRRATGPMFCCCSQLDGWRLARVTSHIARYGCGACTTRQGCILIVSSRRRLQQSDSAHPSRSSSTLVCSRSTR